MKDFYIELFDLITELPRTGFNGREAEFLYDDMVVLGESLEKRGWSGADDVEGNFYPFMGLTYNALILARILNKRLPDYLHSRIVIGEQNEYTRKYIREFL